MYNRDILNGKYTFPQLAAYKRNLAGALERQGINRFSDHFRSGGSDSHRIIYSPAYFFQGSLTVLSGRLSGFYFGLFFYLFTYFIVIFFNCGLIAAAHIRLTGGDPTLRDGLHYAAGHAGQIFIWAGIPATIGLVMSAVCNCRGVAGALVAGIAGTAWSLVTFLSSLS